MTIINKEILSEYLNGSVKTVLYTDGTKTREFNNNRKGEFPESIDIKITNYCDAGCKYCHEKSVKTGKHADLNSLKEILKPLKYTELAIGGGNALSHPDLIDFLYWCKINVFFPSLTVNQYHLKTYFKLINDLIDKKLIYGLGISFISRKDEDIKLISELMQKTDNIVFHLINGINNISDPIYLLTELKKEIKLLILGYKQYGRGIKYYKESVIEKMKEWSIYINGIINNGHLSLFSVLSFDNLAIEQFNLKEIMSDSDFNAFYQGDEFTVSMYIDAVEKKFSTNSRNPIKTDYMNIKDYFNGKR